MTERAVRLVNRYDRLQAALMGTAQVPETVLRGAVTATDGELATVETDVGTVRGLHDGLAVGEATQARIGADAITVHDPTANPDANATSARNRFAGRIVEVDPGETVSTVHVGVDGTVFRALVTDESVSRLELREGRDVALTWKATATRLTRSSPSTE